VRFLCVVPWFGWNEGHRGAARCVLDNIEHGGRLTVGRGKFTTQRKYEYET
jgi:hypothetical protein